MDATTWMPHLTLRRHHAPAMQQETRYQGRTMHIRSTHSFRGTHTGKEPHPTMTGDIRRQAPDEGAANDPDPATLATSLPLESPTRTTSAPPSPPHEDPVIQLSLPINLPQTKQSARKLPSPYPTTLGKTIMQLSPSVNKTLQRPQHTQHITTDLLHQPQKTYTHKRKRPSPTYIPETNRETT
jgi:hypothetical protein